MLNQITPKLAKIFVKDAEKAIIAMEAALQNKYSGDDDIKRHIINAHAMKTALTIVGETELSGLALKLERAGHEKDIQIMLQETPLFIESLRSVVEKIAPLGEENANENDSDYDRVFLKEKLIIIKSSCEIYDKKTAKKTLYEILEKTWPRNIKEQLDNISELLLHSDFEQAVKNAEENILKFCETR